MVTPSLPSTPSLPLTTTLSKLVTLLFKANSTFAPATFAPVLSSGSLVCLTVKFLPASMLTVLVSLMVFGSLAESSVVLPVDSIFQVVSPFSP